MFEDFKSYKKIIAVSVCASAVTAIVVMGIAVIFVMTKTTLLNGGSGPAMSASTGTVKTDSATEESRIVDIAEKANPAVVSIVVSKDVPVIEQYYQNVNPFGDSFFGNPFGNMGFQVPHQRQNGTEKKEVGGGSGFFVSADGFIVTNKHVVDDEKAEYTVLTNDGKKYDAKVLAKDSALDVAILKVEGNDFKYLSFGNSDALKAGQTVIAIGNALAEFRNSVSVGVVSGLSRSITAGDMFGKAEQLEGVIQTDAAINPGNSGGPLLDIKGQVIGINVAVQQGAQNIGFALSANTVKNIVDSVQKNGEIIRPYLGMRYIPITDSLKKKNNLTVDYGMLVSRGETPEDLAVIPGSPADKAGIVEDDIVLEVDGLKLDEKQSLASIIRQKEVGQTVKLKLLHKGKEKIVEVKLEKAPKEA